MQEDVEDAVAKVLAEHRLDAQRVAIVGGSYGGYAAQMGAVRRPDLYRAVISLAGVSDLRAAHIDGFASALGRRGMRPIHRHITVSKVINTLRAIEADRPDRIAPDLHERLRYTLATSAGRSTS